MQVQHIIKSQGFKDPALNPIILIICGVIIDMDPFGEKNVWYQVTSVHSCVCQVSIVFRITSASNRFSLPIKLVSCIEQLTANSWGPDRCWLWGRVGSRYGTGYGPDTGQIQGWIWLLPPDPPQKKLWKVQFVISLNGSNHANRFQNCRGMLFNKKSPG